MSVKSTMNLEVREEAVKKKEAKLATEKARIREAKRKRDDAQKYKYGGLVIKAGLAGESEAVVLGILVNAVNMIEKNRTAYAGIGDQKFRADEAMKAAQTSNEPSNPSPASASEAGPAPTPSSNGQAQTKQPPLQPAAPHSQNQQIRTQTDPSARPAAQSQIQIHSSNAGTAQNGQMQRSATSQNLGGGVSRAASPSDPNHRQA